MSELSQIIKNFLLISIVILLITVGVCSVFIIEENTGAMLFG